MGEDSSTRRPTRDTMRSMICMRCDIVFERQACKFKLSGALDVDPVEAVDQDIGDGLVFQQRLERAQAKDLVENFAGEAFPFGKAERHDFAVDRIANDDQHFIARRVSRGFAQFFQVEAIEDLAMQIGFYLLVIGALERLKISHKALGSYNASPKPLQMLVPKPI